MYKIEQSGGYLGILLGILQKIGFPLMKNENENQNPSAKSVLIPRGLTVVASVTDAAIHKKMFGFATTTLTFSNEGYHENRIWFINKRI